MNMYDQIINGFNSFMLFIMKKNFVKVSLHLVVQIINSKKDHSDANLINHNI